MKMIKYSRRPLVVEAVQLNKINSEKIVDWVGDKRICDTVINVYHPTESIGSQRTEDMEKFDLVSINPLSFEKESTIMSLGDYLAKDNFGQYNHHRKWIFELEYEKVED